MIREIAAVLATGAIAIAGMLVIMTIAGLVAVSLGAFL